jgi:uncharacterized protein YndB with AHSA1/START domain
VFPFFTDPTKMVLWKALRADLDPVPGGRFRIDVNGRRIARGEYVTIDPPRRVVFTWGWELPDDEVPPGATTVEVTLTADGGETILRLVHTGLPDAERDGSAEGWDHYLPRLALTASGEDPGPDPWARPRQAS